jgi:hypothetical protein
MIKKVCAWLGRTKIDLPNPKNKRINVIEFNLNSRKSFEIKLDKDGDICLTSSGNLKLVQNEENQAVFRIK